MPPNMPPFALKTAQYYGKYFNHDKAPIVNYNSYWLHLYVAMNSSCPFLSKFSIYRVLL